MLCREMFAVCCESLNAFKADTVWAERVFVRVKGGGT